jgi:hypothetical protein
MNINVNAVIAAKIHPPDDCPDGDSGWMRSREYIRDSIEVGKELLGVATIDIAFLDVKSFDGSKESIQNIMEGLAAMKEALDAGAITTIGLSSSIPFTLGAEPFSVGTGAIKGGDHLVRSVPLLSLLGIMDKAGLSRHLVALQYPFNITEHGAVTNKVRMNVSIDLPSMGIQMQQGERREREKD